MITIKNQGGMGEDFSKLVVDEVNNIKMGECLSFRLRHVHEGPGDTGVSIVITPETARDLAWVLLGWVERHGSESTLEGEL